MGPWIFLAVTTAHAAPGDVLFREDWTSGSGAWRAVGDPIVLVDGADDEGTTRTWQEETVPASGGRVFTVVPIPVVGGRTYCLSAWMHATAGAAPFLGFNLSDAVGTLGVEHWILGESGPNGYGGSVVAIPQDASAWAWHGGSFTIEADATHLVLKDELWVNGAPGTAHFSGIELAEGACGGPVDTDDGDLDDPVVNEGNVTAGYRGEGGLSFDAPSPTDPVHGGCVTTGTRLSWGLGLAGLLLAMRRRRSSLLVAGIVLAGCGEQRLMWADDAGIKEFGVHLPGFWVEPEQPLSGGNVHIGLEDPGASQIVLSVSGSGCGTVAGAEGVTSASARGQAAAVGACEVVARVTPASGGEAVTFRRGFVVHASDPVLPPFEVEGGVWVEGALPGIGDQPDAPSVTSVDGPTQFINGATLDFEVQSESLLPLRGLVVGFDGTDGSWLVPLNTDGAELLRAGSDGFRVRVPARFFAENANASVGMTVSALDLHGRRGPAQRVQLDGTEVGTGDVQVGISWGTATDVDLHVTEPSGEEISYSHTVSATGGQLDLDSNASCAIDGVQHENVFWPTGQSPEGEYTVRVRMFNDCGVGGATGSVTMTYCGDDSPVLQPFTLGGSGSEASWTFTSSCGGKRVSGRVRYEDFAPTREGFGKGAFVPARHVTVKVVRDADDTELASGTTDAGGFYDLPFKNDGAAGVRVEVQAVSEAPEHPMRIDTLDGQMYVWQTEQVIDDGKDPVSEGVDLDIPASANAGALNLFDVGVRASEGLRAGLGKQPPFLVLRWTKGVATADNSSYYSTPLLGRWFDDPTISVAGGAKDPDEYDDMVIGHEYGHFALQVFGGSNSRGSEHYIGVPSDPTLAWDEGFATWFASQALGFTTYFDVKGNNVPGVVYDIETLPPAVVLGNVLDQMDGRLDEAVVTAVLHDMVDDINEGFDTVSGRDLTTWWVVATPLRDFRQDRGVKGRDLVDFLDAWLCSNLGDVGTEDDGLHGIVHKLHQLTYDFAPGTCGR